MTNKYKFEVITLAQQIFENQKEKFFALIDEKNELKEIASDMLNLEDKLVWHNERLEKYLQTERHKINARITELESLIKSMREDSFTAEQLSELKKEYHNRGQAK